MTAPGHGAASPQRRRSSLVTALGLFTLIPVPPVADIDRVQAARAMRAFPWVGALLGATGAAVMAGAAALMGAHGWLGPALALVVLAGVTGGIHLDGVADTADGLGSRKPREQALAIMRRSDIGPMGVIALLLVLVVQLSALASLPLRPAMAALVVAPGVARLVVTLTTVRSRGARPDGFGALFHGVTSPTVADSTAAAVALVAGALGWWLNGPVGAGALVGCGVLATLAGLGWSRHLNRRFGGLTGDCYGSMIELTQTIGLVVVALSVRLL